MMKETQNTEPIRLTQYSHGAGCGCKIAPAVLETILHSDLPGMFFPGLLVGNESKDDAAVFDLGDGTCIISTTDFFMPIVDDAQTFGAILNDISFSSGVIEFDVKGRNVLQQSFVGIAFLVQDRVHFDAIYFRPFNFMNADTARRHRAVQYISSPDYPWEKLREEHPGVYEHKVSPVPDPDNWFHARVVVADKKVSVFVNQSSSPSLQVTRLTESQSGKVALWVGNGSNGSFANLVITPLPTKAK